LDLKTSPVFFVSEDISPKKKQSTKKIQKQKKPKPDQVVLE